MKQIKRSAIFVSIVELSRFAVLSIMLLPLLSEYFTINENQSSNYRLLLWIISPQLLLGLYAAGTGISVLRDKDFKAVGLFAKALSFVPGVLALIGILSIQGRESGVLFTSVTELQIYLRFALILILDIVSIVTLFMFKPSDDGESQG